MAGVSRVVSVAVVLAVIAASALILLHAFGGHSQPGTVIYDGKAYDCRKVLRSFESTQGPGVYPQPVLRAARPDVDMVAHIADLARQRAAAPAQPPAPVELSALP